MPIELNVNGEAMAADVPSDTPLLWVLRDHFALAGTKYGCGGGYCGACTVQVDGSPARACQLPVSALAGKNVDTIEGLEKRHPQLLKIWVENNVAQCGYCQSGQLMSAAALLESNDKPTDADINAAMAGNICRCGTYQRVRAAIHQAAVDRLPE